MVRPPKPGTQTRGSASVEPSMVARRMPAPVPRTTGCWLQWLRADLPREHCLAYWRGPHARLVAEVGHIDEYRQHHFSPEDHGFWVVPPGVGTTIPADWRIDGMPEVAFAGALAPIRALGPRVWAVYQDESKFIDRILPNLTGPGGGRWFRSGHQEEVGARAVVLIRRRPDVGFREFRSFVHQVLGDALDRAPGTAELRTHSFLPYTKAVWWTPGVAHDNPPHRRYHAAIVLGAADRGALEAILSSPEVTATQDAQAASCLALHAYAADHTYAFVRDGRKLV
jgi:hypothetical protein